MECGDALFVGKSPGRCPSPTRPFASGIRSAIYGQLMATCCAGGEWRTAMELYGAMSEQGLRPNADLFSELTTALAGAAPRPQKSLPNPGPWGLSHGP